MAHRETYAPGTPCWVDLTTPDVAGAIAFYGGLFGWTAREAPDADYLHLERDGQRVAGLAPQDADAGVPPAWAVYVAVEDVEAAADRARALGASVLAGPTTIGDAGRMAALADPLGASFQLWEAGAFHGAALVNDVGAWAWNDLQTSDPAAAGPFYGELFGWQITEIPGSNGAYRSIAHDGRAIGGILTTPGARRSAWATYFGVASAADTLDAIEAAGGRRLTEPLDVPAGRFAGAADPAGAVFSIVEATTFDP